MAGMKGDNLGYSGSSFWIACLFNKIDSKIKKLKARRKNGKDNRFDLRSGRD